VGAAEWILLRVYQGKANSLKGIFLFFFFVFLWAFLFLGDGGRCCTAVSVVGSVSSSRWATHSRHWNLFASSSEESSSTGVNVLGRRIYYVYNTNYCCIYLFFSVICIRNLCNSPVRFFGVILFCFIAYIYAYSNAM